MTKTRLTITAVLAAAAALPLVALAQTAARSPATSPAPGAARPGLTLQAF